MSEVPPDLGALYKRYGDGMRKVAASVLRESGRASEAADAVQDAIVSIMASPPRNRVRNWEAFLVLAAKRKALDRVRSARVRRAGGDFVDAVPDRSDDSDLADEVADALEQQRQAERVRDCLSVLDDRHQHVVWQIVALGRPRAEVAAELGVTPSRVSQMTTKSLVLLRDEMDRREAPDNE